MNPSDTKPWDEAKLAASSHFDLLMLRTQFNGNQEAQNVVSKYEHRAFAREAVEENPIAALGLVAAIPAYQAAKATGLIGSRSEPSLAQAAEGYKGVGEGLANAAKKPWDEAKETISYSIGQVKEASRNIADGIFPWEEAQKAVPSITKIDPFELVFNRLMHQESRGKHLNSRGTLTTSGKGARGITQLMPHTGANPGYGVTPLKDETEAEYKRFGRDYLRAMLNEFDGDYEKALAAYNAGVGNVKKAVSKGGEKWKDFLPKKSETLPYIDKILGISTAHAQEVPKQKFPGMLQEGNIDLTKRPKVKNKDGSISTVRSISINMDGKEILIPTVSDDGKILSDDDAVKLYKKTGKHLGIFKTSESATVYAEKLHLEQEQMYVRKK